MRKIHSLLLSLAMLAALTACDDQLDIVPKGQTTLGTVTDLEYLLNQEYSLEVAACADLGMICDESLGWGLNIPEVLSQPNTLNYAYLTYNEGVDRVTLSQSDARYNAAYKYINYMNTVIDKMPSAEGDAALKPQLVAEARVMRAYLHFLLVNIHAPQYDAATASTDGGIPYCDDLEVQEQKTKLTVAEVYDRILADCADDVLADLPESDGDNVLRADRAFGYAVRAKVLMQMKRYADALPYAQQALQLNGGIEDRTSLAYTYSWELPQDFADNYVYIHGAARVAPFMEILSFETGGMPSTTGGGDSDYDPDEDYDDDDDYYDDEDDYYDSRKRTRAADEDYYDPDEDYDDDDGDSGDSGETDNGLFEDGDYVLNYTSSWSAVFGQMMAGISAKYCFAMNASVNEYGITSDRMYYTAAECLIRTGLIREGLELVDQVRAYRVENYQPYAELCDQTELSEQEAMTLLQKAKWVECIGTYENFFDCKRWNTEDNYRRTITRNLGYYGTFTLAPDSPLWIIPFPSSATQHNSSLSQNF